MSNLSLRQINTNFINIASHGTTVAYALLDALVSRAAEAGLDCSDLDEAFYRLRPIDRKWFAHTLAATPLLDILQLPDGETRAGELFNRMLTLDVTDASLSFKVDEIMRSLFVAYIRTGEPHGVTDDRLPALLANTGILAFLTDEQVRSVLLSRKLDMIERMASLPSAVFAENALQWASIAGLVRLPADLMHKLDHTIPASGHLGLLLASVRLGDMDGVKLAISRGADIDELQVRHLVADQALTAGFADISKLVRSYRAAGKKHDQSPTP